VIALYAALAAAMDVGAGIRETPGDGATFEGARLVFRGDALPWLAIEGDAFVWTTPMRGPRVTAIVEPESGYPGTLDRFALSALAHFAPPWKRRADEVVGVRPVGLAGLEIREELDYFQRYDSGTSWVATDRTVELGPVAGGAVELEVDHGFVLRAGAVLRYGVIRGDMAASGFADVMMHIR
jgi:hypothetical protein